MFFVMLHTAAVWSPFSRNSALRYAARISERASSRDNCVKSGIRCWSWRSPSTSVNASTSGDSFRNTAVKGSVDTTSAFLSSFMMDPRKTLRKVPRIVHAAASVTLSFVASDQRAKLATPPFVLFSVRAKQVTSRMTSRRPLTKSPTSRVASGTPELTARRPGAKQATSTSARFHVRAKQATSRVTLSRPLSKQATSIVASRRPRTKQATSRVTSRRPRVKQVPSRMTSRASKLPAGRLRTKQATSTLARSSVRARRATSTLARFCAGAKREASRVTSSGQRAKPPGSSGTSRGATLDPATSSVASADPKVPAREQRTKQAVSRPPATFTDAATAGTRVKAVHLTEFRTALDLARSALLPAGGYTGGSLTRAAIKTVYVEELRSAIQ